MSSGSLPMATYHRTQAVGAGTFGSVLTVYNDDGEEFAMKLFIADEGEEREDETLDAGALREISILRLLREENAHPNIVPMADVRGAEGDDEDEGDIGAGTSGCLGMAMPMYPLGNLDKAIQDQAMIHSRAARIQIAHGLLSAITYLHENGIMHRDLKCDNILLEEESDGTIKPVLIDFSLAKIVHGAMFGAPENCFAPEDDGEGTHTGECGTLGYIAPEVQACEPYGLSSDIWSVGVILLELLQKQTLEIQKYSQVEPKIQEGLDKLPADKPFPTLVRNFLKKEPSDRWTARQSLENLSQTLFSSQSIPPVKIINLREALPFDDEDDDEHETENVAPPAKKTPSKSKSPKKRADPVLERRKKKIKQLCHEVEAINPMTIQAAFCYCQRMLELDDELDDLSSSQSMLDCVILAHKFNEVDVLDLTELEENYKSFSNWSLDEYRDNEATILMMMDHCLYPRELVDMS